jgi:hypothetical protein
VISLEWEGYSNEGRQTNQRQAQHLIAKQQTKAAFVGKRCDFEKNPNTLWPTSLVDWFVILMLVGLLVGLLGPAIGLDFVVRIK